MSNSEQDVKELIVSLKRTSQYSTAIAILGVLAVLFALVYSGTRLSPLENKLESKTKIQDALEDKVVSVTDAQKESVEKINSLLTEIRRANELAEELASANKSNSSSKEERLIQLANSQKQLIEELNRIKTELREAKLSSSDNGDKSNDLKLMTFKLFRSDVDRSPPDYQFIYCRSPEAWAVDRCHSKIDIKKNSDEGGGKCGHATYTVSCYVKD